MKHLKRTLTVILIVAICIGTLSPLPLILLCTLTEIH